MRITKINPNTGFTSFGEVQDGSASRLTKHESHFVDRRILSPGRQRNKLAVASGFATEADINMDLFAHKEPGFEFQVDGTLWDACSALMLRDDINYRKDMKFEENDIIFLFMLCICKKELKPNYSREGGEILFTNNSNALMVRDLLRSFLREYGSIYIYNEKTKYANDFLQMRKDTKTDDILVTLVNLECGESLTWQKLRDALLTGKSALIDDFIEQCDKVLTYLVKDFEDAEDFDSYVRLINDITTLSLREYSVKKGLDNCNLSSFFSISLMVPLMLDSSMIALYLSSVVNNELLLFLSVKAEFLGRNDILSDITDSGLFETIETIYDASTALARWREGTLFADFKKKTGDRIKFGELLDASKQFIRLTAIKRTEADLAKWQEEYEAASKMTDLLNTQAENSETVPRKVKASLKTVAEKISRLQNEKAEIEKQRQKIIDMNNELQDPRSFWTKDDTSSGAVPLTEGFIIRRTNASTPFFKNITDDVFTSADFAALVEQPGLVVPMFSIAVAVFDSLHTYHKHPYFSSNVKENAINDWSKDVVTNMSGLLGVHTYGVLSSKVKRSDVQVQGQLPEVFEFMGLASPTMNIYRTNAAKEKGGRASEVFDSENNVISTIGAIKRDYEAVVNRIRREPDMTETDEILMTIFGSNEEERDSKILKTYIKYASARWLWLLANFFNPNVGGYSNGGLLAINNITVRKVYDTVQHCHIQHGALAFLSEEEHYLLNIYPKILI